MQRPGAFVRRALLATLVGAAPLGEGVARAQEAPQSAQLEADIVAFEELLNERISQLSALEAELQETEAQLAERVAERDRLSAEVTALSAEGEALEAQIRDLNAQQETAAARIEALQLELAGLEAQLKELLVSLHKRRTGRYARLLAESETLFELRVRNYYLSRLTERDVALLEAFEAGVAELEAERAARAEQLEALAARERELAANRTALERAQTELASAVAALEGTRAGQLAQQQALLEEQSRIETELVGARAALAEVLERQRQQAAERAEAERRRAEAERAEAERLAERQAASEAEAAAREAASAEDDFAAEAARLEELIRALSEPAPAAETDFMTPIPDPVIVRAFGEGGASDIWLQAEEPGTAVQAVKSGVVYQASRITANSGYTVAIQHEGDLISAYTNLQPPEVEVGERVRQGQILGYLGGGIIAPNVLQFRLGTQSGAQIVYQDPAPLIGVAAGD
jgi:murein DD-endopeptidase MepM/ murein hydrolase activator NlpD